MKIASVNIVRMNLVLMIAMLVSPTAGFLTTAHAQARTLEEEAANRRYREADAAYARTPRPAASPASPVAQGNVDLTGQWAIKTCPQCPPWKITQTGSAVTANWKGGPGHGGLVGEFQGNMTSRGQTVYVEGPLRITEGQTRVTGTMTFTVRSANELYMEYVQSNGVKGVMIFVRGDHGSHRYPGPVRIDIRYHANSLPTAPPSDAGSCPTPIVMARITGTIEARITEPEQQGPNHEGGGDVVATPHLSRCRVPVINIRVENVEVNIIRPGRIMQARLRVRITQEGVHQPGDCKQGTTGTITATYDDSTRAANSLPNHSLEIGPWDAPCAAHTYTITNSLSSIAADAPSSTWVRVSIACRGQNTGFGPQHCGT